jgi:hypothetical protein
MNIAEVLESTASTNRVHFSETTKASADTEAVSGRSQYSCEPGPSRLVTSKNEEIAREAIDGLRTFLLIGKEQTPAPTLDCESGSVCREASPEPQHQESSDFDEEPVQVQRSMSTPGIGNLCHTTEDTPKLPHLLEQLDLAVQTHSKVACGNQDCRNAFEDANLSPSMFDARRRLKRSKTFHSAGALL